MTLNHIPGNKDISDWGRPMGEEVFYDGLGFGLGFAVVIDQAKTKVAMFKRNVQLGRYGEHCVLD
jgi:hypothetical protein